MHCRVKVSAHDEGAVGIVVGGIRPAAAVQHHHGRMRRGAGRLEEVGDDLGRAVGAFEIDGLRRRACGDGGEEGESEEEEAHEEV